MGRRAIVKRLFQSIEDEARMGRPAGPPANDSPSISIDDEGDVDEPCLGRDVGMTPTSSMSSPSKGPSGVSLPAVMPQQSP